MKLWIFACLFLAINLCGAWTKEEVYKKMTANATQTKVAYEAKIETRMKMGEALSLSDSGTMVFSPPNCFKMTMIHAGVETSGCGDTVWSKNKDGSVTRSLNKGGANPGGKAPDMKSMLGGMDFLILGEKPGKHLELEVKLKENGVESKARLIVDTQDWLLKRISVTAPSGETVEIGYGYQKIAGESLLNEINTVFGNGGFVRMKFLNIKKIAMVPSKEFRIF